MNPIRRRARITPNEVTCPRCCAPPGTPCRNLAPKMQLAPLTLPHQDRVERAQLETLKSDRSTNA